jgi:hypothetical protein
MAVRGLGNLFDIGTAIAPVDLAAGANTGHRLHLRNYGGVCIVLYFEVGAAAEPVIATVREHDAATSGNSADLAVVTQFFSKSEAVLDGDEAWVRVTQTAAATVTDADWDDALQALVAIEVDAGALSDDYEWISVNIADTGTTTGHLGCALYIPYGLKVMRRSDLLPQPNA